MQTFQLGEQTRFRSYGPRQLRCISERFGLAKELHETVRLLSLVLPFRVNEYVLTELIDWSRVPCDPMFQLVFPQANMLKLDDERELARLADTGGNSRELAAAIARIRSDLNPHPSRQQELNVPSDDGIRLPGMQHKYRETVLYFPAHGQTCHAYCTYCFRWAQFVGDSELRFAAPGPERLVT